MNGRHPLILALVIQVLVFPLALGLALALGVTPWTDFDPSAAAVLLALAGTVPLVAILHLFHVQDPDWFRALSAQVEPAIRALFDRQGRGVVMVVAILAGFGEELLFRGVLQAWMTGWMNPGLAIVLAALAFGILHCLSRAYFVYATLMGIYLGVIYELTGNLLIICLIHALYDWIAIHYLLRREGSGTQ